MNNPDTLKMPCWGSIAWIHNVSALLGGTRGPERGLAQHQSS